MKVISAPSAKEYRMSSTHQDTHLNVAAKQVGTVLALLVVIMFATWFDHWFRDVYGNRVVTAVYAIMAGMPVTLVVSYWLYRRRHKS